MSMEPLRKLKASIEDALRRAESHEDLITQIAREKELSHALIKVIRDMEWISTSTRSGFCPSPFCNMDRDAGHAPDCPVARILKKVG